MPLAPDRVDYLPIIDRPVIKWPNDAKVAFWVVPNIEHYEYLPPLDGARNPWPRTPLPDAQQYSMHEYGNRVGFWRLLDILDEYGIRCSTSLNIGILERFPDITEAMLRRDWSFINHGFYNSRFITTFSEEQEVEFFQQCREIFRRRTGREIKGCSGPAASNTEATPDVVAEAGFVYQTDWKIDDQPLPIRVRSGKLVCVPYTSELNDAGELHALPVSFPLDDVSALWDRHLDIDQYETMIRETFDTLHRDGAENGRLLALSLHPFLIGQPFRIGSFDAALSHVRKHDGVWAATGSEIVEWARRLRIACE